MAETKLDQALTVAELMDAEVMIGAELIAGHDGVGQAINAVNVMTVPDIGRWVRDGEFLLATGYPLPRDDQGQVSLIQDLHALGVVGVGIKLDRYMPELSNSVVAAADELEMPLVVIPERVRFDDILSRSFATIVNRQASALERAQEIHSSFLDITLSGGGLAKLASKLSALLGDAAVAITDPQGSVLAQGGEQDALADVQLRSATGVDVGQLVGEGMHHHEPSGRRWVARQIRAGNLRHGFVVAAEGPGRFGEFGLVALDQAAIVAALEITRDLAVGAVERRFSANVLFDLITGEDTELADSTARSAGFGWDLDRDVVVLVGRNEASSQEFSSEKGKERLAEERAVEFWTSAVRSQDPAAAAAGLGVELVAVMGAPDDAVATARAIQNEVSTFTRGQYAIGVSRVYPGPQGIAAAHLEARMALRLGHRVSGPASVTAYGELGLYRILAQVDDPELRAFAQETLGPLLRLGEPDRTEMTETLKALVRHNMNMAETARDLHYHYNTLRYRLSKLERLLGPFSSEVETTVRVCVALQIVDMQAHRSRPPS